MGCSYDPVPYTVYPTQWEMFLKDNDFWEDKQPSYSSYSFPKNAICDHCGVFLTANITLVGKHCGWCPVNPRDVVPAKTDEELKQFPRTVYK